MNKLLQYGLMMMLVLALGTSIVKAGDEACDSGNCMSTRVMNLWACTTCPLEKACSSSLETCFWDSDCGPYGGDCVWQCLDQNFQSKCKTTGTTTVTCNNTGTYNCSYETNSYRNCHDSTGECNLPYEYANWGCCGPSDGTTPKGCGGSCSGNSGCDSGYCTGGVCRNADCPSETDCTCPTAPSYSCSVAISASPAPANSIVLGETKTYTATVTESNGTYTDVTLVPVNGTGTIDPAAAVSGTSIAVTGTGAGDASVIARVYRGGTIACSTTQAIAVSAPDVKINVWKSNSLVACLKSVAATGTVEMYNGSKSYDVTQTLSGGTATFTKVPAGNYIAKITPEAGLAAIGGCGASDISVKVPSTTYTYNRYFSPQAKPWWQVVGGDAHAAVVTVITPGINTLMAHYGGTINSSGVLAAPGKIDTTKVIVGPDTRNWAAPGSSYEAPKERFSYFVRSFELGVAPVVDNPGGTIADDPGVDGAYYLTGDVATSALNLSTPVTDSRTYFITGDLTVDSDIIVTPGAFLAFVVKGNIIINGDVSQVQGMYIADGTLTVTDGPGSGAGGLDSPRQFEGQGTFVGWQNVVLNRDLDDPTISTDDLDNNQFPATKIIYRPDFLLNAPDGFKHNSILWQEIAP